MANCQLLVTSNEPAALPCSFTARFLAITVLETNKPPTWFTAGYLNVLVNIGGQSYLTKRIKLTFEPQILEMPSTAYTLVFERSAWLLNTLIKINELTSQEAEIFMPLFAPIPTSIADQPVFDSVPTTFNAPQYLAATLPVAYQALAPNASRQKFAVTNTGTATVFLDLDAPTGLTKRFVAVPVNGTYVLDFDYQGAVFLWSSNAAAQSCEVRELLQ